ncbi:hypothetical protein HOF65_06595 [bacterium]|nr:hypothetical protein [bacterium]MBT3853593.1 hypothetical protein [bacterium]MBT4632893.1 hypothetical protein [bacterium]MBT6778777.1 hypothetical protein [bacterium]
MRVVTLFNPNCSTNSSIAFNFFHTESIHVNFTSVFIIARGIRGNHHPVHISATFHSSSTNTFNIIESIKCFSIIQSASLIADRLI